MTKNLWQLIAIAGPIVLIFVLVNKAAGLQAAVTPVAPGVTFNNVPGEVM